MNKDYWQGWHDARRQVIHDFCERFNEIKHHPGIGEKTVSKVAEALDIKKHMEGNGD
ncbi:hypothetical protein SAMN05192534_12426 [Alteribacillus persepolensis]|uniref:Uncharacterized protein n=1 Tax=Alteribacillus persepolensis TaxID=568899 RepID=A0A1G8IHE3_9BACI|nr:hypothetical protein [Alteribacillus persepolensis]SDI18429.1 hypothetical protein SAMN05192534_12426 [Alteribacillus persepolensis]